MSLNTAHISLIRQTFTAIGATLPKGVTKALEERDKLATLRVPVATGDQVADAVADCLLAGRDPLDDDQVRRLATSRALTGSLDTEMSYSVGQAAERRVVAALGTHLDQILGSLTTAAAQAGDVLADAFGIIGDVELSESELILRMGPDAARAWAEARDAVLRLRKIDSAWVALANLTHFAPTSVDQTTRLADLDLEQFEKVGRKADPWTIVRNGGTIALADGTTIRERADRIAAAKQKRQTAAAKGFTETYRRTHGVVTA